MRELRFNAEGKEHAFQVPERYDEMNEHQFRAAILKMMNFAERGTFWESFAGIPPRFSGGLPEWMHLEMNKMVEFIPRLDESLDYFIMPRLPLTRMWPRRSLYAPKKMLAGMSLQQFMAADNYFGFYAVTQRESFIDLLVASIYLAPNETFVIEDKKDKLVPLEERELYIHNHVPVEARFGVFVNWIFVKNWLTSIYPNLFQRGKSDGKPKASDWLPLFDSFVGDNIPFIREYQRMPCMDAFRIIDGKIRLQNERKRE